MPKEIRSRILTEIIAGTKKKKRPVKTLKVAENLKLLYDQTKSLEKVSRLKGINLSPEMIRQFIKLLSLADEVKKLYAEGLLNGVDVGYRLSKMRAQDQIILAKHITKRNLNSDDVRNIVRYKLDNPTIDINKAVDRVLRSKDIKIYVAYFELNDALINQLKHKWDIQQLSAAFKSILEKTMGKGNLLYFSFKKNVITIKVSYAGLVKLRQKAKELRVPLKKLAIDLIRSF